MRTLKSETLIKPLKSYEFDFYVSKILETFGADKCYLLGGAVRDVLIQDLYGLKYDPRDLDIIINTDKDITAIMSRWSGTRLNSYGDTKWKTPNKEIDVFPASTLYNHKFSIEGILNNVDFSINSVLYSFSDRAIYDLFCINSLKRNEIEWVNNNYGTVINMAKGMIFRRKFTLNIGPKMQSWIQAEYDPKDYAKIEEFLAYKGWENWSEIIRKDIEEII